MKRHSSGVSDFMNQIDFDCIMKTRGDANVPEATSLDLPRLSDQSTEAAL